jgi:hypothetical protein
MPVWSIRERISFQTDNIIVGEVQLRDGCQLQYHYQLQYILASVRSSAESEMPNALQEQRDQGEEYIFNNN